MRRLLIYAATVFMAGIATVRGQEQDSTQYINGLPVSEDDTALYFPQHDFEPKTRLTPLAPDALPGKVFRALNEERQYEGWRDTIVYFDSNTRLFLVPVKTEDGIRIFGLDEDGNPVTFDEVSSSPE